jgi:hypothetical protein
MAQGKPNRRPVRPLFFAVASDVYMVPRNVVVAYLRSNTGFTHGLLTYTLHVLCDIARMPTRPSSLLLIIKYSPLCDNNLHEFITA